MGVIDGYMTVLGRSLIGAYEADAGDVLQGRGHHAHFGITSLCHLYAQVVLCKAVDVCLGFAFVAHFHLYLVLGKVQAVQTVVPCQQGEYLIGRIGKGVAQGGLSP